MAVPGKYFQDCERPVYGLDTSVLPTLSIDIRFRVTVRSHDPYSQVVSAAFATRHKAACSVLSVSSTIPILVPEV
jgi:hypothetical protein